MMIYKIQRFKKGWKYCLHLRWKKIFNTARNTNLTPTQKVDIKIDNQLGEVSDISKRLSKNLSIWRVIIKRLFVANLIEL